MVSAVISRRRSVLYMAAVMFGVASALYSIVWVYYAPQGGTTKVAAEFTYSLPSRYLRVSRVVPESNAWRAELRAGDRILAINNAKLDRLTPYYDFVDSGKPGDIIQFSLLRPGQDSPRDISVVMEKPRPRIEAYSDTTPSRTIVLEIMRSYPILFLVVGMAVLFLKVEDLNAWLLALFFTGFIALPDLPPGVFPPALRGFMMAFHVVMSGLAPALLYFFLAVFPGRSPLERRAPWLKWVFIGTAAGFAAAGLWTTLTANAYDTIWLPLEYGGPTWVRPLIRGLGNLYSIGAEVLAVASLVGNSLQADTPEAQRKARVVVWGTACGLLPIVLLVVALSLTGRNFQETPFWLYAFCVLALFLLPVSFAYAVVKHRVMEIPVLLKRSARYVLVQRGFVLLTALWGTAITTLFIFVALKLAHLLPLNPQVGLWVIAGVAVSFGSVLTLTGANVHQRVATKIDRAFFRSAYDARVVLQELSEQVRTAGSRGKLAALLEEQIGAALHPASLRIFLEGRPGVLVNQREDSSAELVAIPASLPALVDLARRAKPVDVPPSSGGSGGFPMLAALHPECLVPILGLENCLTGLLVLGPRLSEEPYSSEDKQLLASVASQAGIALDNLHLAEEIAERLEAEQRAAREMDIAREVQARLLPQNQPPLATLEYAGRCLQARQVGGDYYDFLDLGPGRVGFLLADIAGKGISGALLMANLQANLRSQYAVALQDPSRLLRSVNQLFFENTADNSYATLFFADYDDASRQLRYGNCGHNPPVLVRANGKVERLAATTTVLGLFQEWECPVEVRTLQPGDTLVIYSDGVTEEWSDEGEEFGEARLLETILKHRHLSPLELLSRLLETVQKFTGIEQEDDLTLVVAKAQ